MASVYDVANFFVDIANKSDDDNMTNLKVNKLLYYAQGAFLARYGRRLFDCDIQAWELGPVVPCVYHKYKYCGRNPIQSIDETYSPNLFSQEELETLLDVMREKGKYTGSALVRETHKPGTPWSNSFEGSIISDGLMREYFTKYPLPAFDEVVKAPIISVLPNEWYDPEEDEVWEAYL